ncbi:MAG: hypothetical protein EA377_08105 [Phycisphaerales bacterium]|nr:MAG: hypothetical protein EA377_08105 [Phycisphaerales bacterium]
MRQKSRRFVNWPAVLIAVMFVSFAGYQTYALRGMESPKPTAVATVDLERLFNQLDEREAADRELQRLVENLQSDGDAMVREIERLEEELEMYDSTSRAYQETLNKLSLKGMEYRAFVEFTRRRIDVEKAVTLKRIYVSIKMAASEDAKERGYDIVFVDDSLGEIPPAGEQETTRQISARRMLYASSEIDLTDQLLERMNREFQARAGAE